ncbi:hypothetical protein N7494_007271 [Penicillium frequentans]|uniref:Zn(2)-C6 fungal-type domain-containing protein n=1 Tax=Penicillium frequentans TaxID=3151616 RepID=A0AAD6GEI6_9EURO|nr:hypothetical protein N7494_007271 [Penicillium glabrum]
MACVSCRESKVKCDGLEPACSTCVNRNRECRYHAIDKRKLPLRVAIDFLTMRVDQLCLFITENGLQPPQLPPEEDQALKNILESLGLNNETKSTPPLPNEPEAKKNCEVLSVDSNGCLPDLPQNFVAAATTSGSVDSGTDTFAERNIEADIRAVSSSPQSSQNMPFDFSFIETSQNIGEGSPSSFLGSWDTDLRSLMCVNPTAAGMQNLFGLSHGSTGVEPEGFVNFLDPIAHDDDETLVEEPETAEDIESLIDEISDRVGTLRIGPGGKTRFCGPTSTFNLAGVLESEEPASRSSNELGTLEEHDRSWSDPEIPADLEEHLINLYFCWQDPFCHVVDREMYTEAKKKWWQMEDTPFYSETLRYAMCAIGSAFESRFHPALITFPKSLIDFLGARVKSLLELELDNPCVATVQALVIMSHHEIGNGKDTRGWLFSGMAMRLSFDLALHLDMSEYVSTGDITSAGAELRRTVFWAAYTVDHQLGFHLGRPSRTSMEDVTVRKPQAQAGQPGQHRWAPYETQGSYNSTAGLLDCTEAVSQQMVSLCELMAPCGYILYGTSRISKPVLQDLNANIVAELRRWKSNLPPVLQINLHDYTSPYLPHVLLLHMQYHQNIIYAHRPWMSKKGLQPDPPKGPGYLHAREMCISSAIAISKILVLYETRYTLRRINVKAVSITSSAILLLLFASVTKYPAHSQSDITRSLSSCFRALDEFSRSWKSAGRAKDLLVNLQRQWELRARFRNDIRDPKRGSCLPRKRSRDSNKLYRVTPAERETFTRRRCEPEMDFHSEAESRWMPMDDARLVIDNCSKGPIDIVPGAGFDAPQMS